MPRNLVRATQYTVLFLSGASFFLIDHMPGKFADIVTENYLLGIAFVSLGTLFLSIHAEMLAIKIDRSPIKMHQSLADGLAWALAERSSPHLVRIYAQSTENILPGFRQRLTSANECRLLLRRFEPGQRIEESQAVDRYIRSWERMQSDGTIGKVDIHRYLGIPTVYVVLIDSSIALVGWYSLNLVESYEVDFSPPMTIEANDSSSNLAIQQLITWFDKNFDSWGTAP